METENGAKTETGEVWREMPGTDGLYYVSNLGNFASKRNWKKKRMSNIATDIEQFISL